jgi:hypothetical protein
MDDIAYVRFVCGLTGVDELSIRAQADSPMAAIPGLIIEVFFGVVGCAALGEMAEFAIARLDVCRPFRPAVGPVIDVLRQDLVVGVLEIFVVVDKVPQEKACHRRPACRASQDAPF